MSMDDEMETASDKPKVFLETEEVETPKEEVKPMMEMVHEPQVQPEVEGAKNGGYKWLVMIVVVLVVAAVVVWGIIFWQKSQPATKVTIDISSTTSTVVESPTPTLVEFKLSDYKIKVLNGSGIAGEAGRVKTLLETAGFVVESTANAETYDFTKTIVSAGSKVVPGFVSKLQDELGKKYTIGSAGSLGEDMEVEIVVGSEKAQ